MARRESEPWRRAIAVAVGAALLAAASVYAASAILAEHTGGVTGVPGQWKLLQLYDLIGEAKVDPALKLGELARVNPDLEQLIHSDGTRLYTPARNDTLVGSTDLQDEFASTSPATIASQWNETLLAKPQIYLTVRARVFAWLFFTPDPVQCDAF